jgi:hypothetical protein
MAKKPTARQRDISRLATQYQKDISDVSQQMQGVTSTPSGLEEFQQKSTDYQKRLQDYRAMIEQYQKDPFERMTVPSAKYNFRAGSYDLNMPGQGMVNYNQLQDWSIESIGREVKTNKGRTPDMAYDIVLKRDKPFPGQFTEPAPTPPDTTSREEGLSALQEKRQSLEEGFQREVAERKAGRMAAVGRRSQSRPMLSKGVTL